MGNLVSYPSELGQDSGKPDRRFDLKDDAAYQAWRSRKLADYPQDSAQLRVDVARMADVSAEERQAITALCARTNMAIYATAPDSPTLRQDIVSFATAFGLCRCEVHRSAEEDGLVPIEVADSGGRQGFIPYTTKPLSWHTDGYYNTAQDRIRAVLMHCVRPAASGGVNFLFDPEIAYIRLRDENPAFIKALNHRRCMTIPGFTDKDGTFREERTGPVLLADRFTGALLMRFTARKRNVIWRDDKTTAEAVAFLNHVLDNDPLVFKVELGAGEGIICNNVLHNRTGFTDTPTNGKGRLLYRARYKDRVLGT